MRLHPEGLVGAEAAPRTPCGKHCQRWCSTPPPASRQESSNSDTNFIKHSILLFLSKKIIHRRANWIFPNPPVEEKRAADRTMKSRRCRSAKAKPSGEIFNRFAGVSIYISDSSLAYFTRTGSLDFDPPPPFPWPRIENTALRFPPRGGI
ncbi:hypothetical protein ALC60_13668 [Trachymyrmex zeteki]|uniref:Uncharacterized protein n=1 Tax=Mycetomoellerius zeteki TaxID=64791 RepID=A0A151WHL4_9HYME|nr:hypothetical protein ALC60_13668 [Trachymyrmex zeteki]